MVTLAACIPHSDEATLASVPTGRAAGSTTALIAAKGLAAALDVLGTSCIPAWHLTDPTQCTEHAAFCRLTKLKPDSTLGLFMTLLQVSDMP